MNANERDFIFRTIESRDVHFVRFWFTDIFGILKQIAVIPSELECAFEEGMGFDGSGVAGFSAGDTCEMLAFPDPSTFQILPWRPQTNAVARMFCDICTPELDPSEADSRSILRRVVNKAASLGYVMNVGPELEYYCFKDDLSPEPLDRGSYYDCATMAGAADLRRDTIITLEKMGIPVEFSHHEGGPSQYEIDLRYADAMTMADNMMTYKMVVKSVAQNHHVYASFMPQPLVGQPGNGMHIHLSLSDLNGNNLFYDEADNSGYRLSDLARFFLAGVLKFAPEFCLITNPVTNSYKRLSNQYRAARHIAWAHSSRTSLIRIPAYKPHKKGSCRIEVRNPDASANPYLTLACLLKAGLYGIENRLEAPSPVELENLTEASRVELRNRNIQSLPETLGEAIDAFESSAFMKELLGSRTHSFMVTAKRKEWLSYMHEVSQWELNQYLSVL